MSYAMKPNYQETIDLEGYEVRIPSGKDAWDIRVWFNYSESDSLGRAFFYARTVEWETYSNEFGEIEHHTVHDVEVYADDFLHACMRIRDRLVKDDE